jgi:vacuolar-type H+-ATPase subunit H
MPRPKKTELSDTAAGSMKKPTKRGNPDFVSSSFYVPKKVNFKFDRAILTLKTNGIDVDRSDVLSCLMDRFGVLVDEAEKKGEGELNFDGLIEEGTEYAIPMTSGLSFLKEEMLRQKKAESDLMAQLDEACNRKDKAYAESQEHTDQLIRLMLQHIPASERDQFQKAYEHFGEDPEKFVAEQGNSSEEIAKLKSTYESVIEQMLRFVPDNEDRRIVEEILASLKG